jgi:hypothetical protein
MKKLLAGLLVAGAAGFLVWNVLAPAPRRSCARLAELCGQPAEARDRCVHGMTELGASNREAAARFDRCIGDAGGCIQATGCLVGAGISAAGGALENLVKSIGKATGS